jgi:hypothetical protein
MKGKTSRVAPVSLPPFHHIAAHQNVTVDPLPHVLCLPQRLRRPT